MCRTFKLFQFYSIERLEAGAHLSCFERIITNILDFLRIFVKNSSMYNSFDSRIPLDSEGFLKNLENSENCLESI